MSLARREYFKAEKRQDEEKMLRWAKFYRKLYRRFWKLLNPMPNGELDAMPAGLKLHLREICLL